MKHLLLKILVLIFSASIFSCMKKSIEFTNILIISIDSLHPDALSGENSPNISGIMKKGNFTLKGKSIDPPKTLYNHTAMFIGKHPREIGKDDNEWKEGEPRVGVPTIFRSAKENGYKTAYFYSKSKLGYLATPDIETVRFAGLESPEEALSFYQNQNNRSFVFLHVSGLEFTGIEKGWMSPDYLQTLYIIDARIKPVIDMIDKRGKFIIIITSDHAGHGLLHGTDHPDDFKLPFIFYSDVMKMTEIQDAVYTTNMLKRIVEKILMHKF